MPTSFTTRGVSLLVVATVLVVALGGLALLVTCRVVGQKRPRFGHACGIMLLQLLAAVGVTAWVHAVMGPAGSAGEQLGLAGMSSVATVLIVAGFLRATLCDGFGRALGIAVVAPILAALLCVGAATGLVMYVNG